MIRIFESKNILGDIVQEFSCPRCLKPIKWEPTGVAKQLSPFSCMGCMETLPDVSEIIISALWRARYHFGGRSAVKCGYSGPTKI